MSDECPNSGVSEGEWIDNIGSIFEKKAALRQVYEDYYQEIRKLVSDGKTLEVGSASGNFSGVFSDIIHTDIIPTSLINVAADAQQMPFRDSSFHNIIAIDVLHHIEWPVYFLKEAARLLKPGGKLIMLEPAITPGSWLFYKYYHVEDMDMSVYPLEKGAINPSRDARLANQAIATLLIGKYRSALKEEVPEFQQLDYSYHTLLAFPLSGAFRSWSLLPSWAVQPVLSIERLLLPFIGRFFSFRLLISLKVEDILKD